MNKLAKDVLLRATQLIADKTRWIRYTGFRIGPSGPTHFYCALGAIELARMELGAHAHTGNVVVDALRQTLRRKGHNRGVAAYNDDDSTTHKDVKEAFCETVKRECCGDTELEKGA